MLRPPAPVLALLAVAALLASPAPAAQTGPAAGIDPRHLDARVSACEDFYRHANGGWLQTHPVPAGIGSHGLFEQLRARHQQQRLQRITQLAGDASRVGEPLADFLASGMDEATIEAAGAAPLAALLEPVGRLTTPAQQLMPLLASLHAQGLPVLFRADVASTPRGHHLRLLAGGLGLPDRDYYLREDAEARALLGHYRRYVERILALAGSADPAADAAWVLDAEMRLARGWPPHGEAAPELAAATLRDLGRRHAAIDWRPWLAAHGLARTRELTLAHPAYFSELNTLIAGAHPTQWQAYLRFHIAHLMAPFLSADFVQAHDQLFQRVLRGRTQPLTRAERVLEAVDRVLAPAFERDLADWLLPPAQRQAAEALVASIRAELRSGLADAPWLDEASRGPAQQRLDQLTVEIALAAEGGATDGAAFHRDRFADNVLQAARRLHHDRLSPLTAGRTPPARRPQGTPPMAALYDPRSNKLQLGLGVLQAPLFDPHGDVAVQYGSLGALIGHELMHGFDLAGAAWAQETPSPARVQAFEAHVAPLVAQYDGFELLGRRIDGTRTLAENAADLGGLELAWRAFVALPPPTGVDANGHAAEQRFWLGWAQMWRRNYRDEDLLRRIAQDPQPPSPLRVNGPLAHLSGFAAAFGCSAGQPMVHPAPLRMFR